MLKLAEGSVNVSRTTGMLTQKGLTIYDCDEKESRQLGEDLRKLQGQTNNEEEKQTDHSARSQPKMKKGKVKTAEEAIAELGALSINERIEHLMGEINDIENIMGAVPSPESSPRQDKSNSSASKEVKESKSNRVTKLKGKQQKR